MGGVLYNSIIIKVWHERNSKNLIKTEPILVESLGLLWEDKKCVCGGGRERETHRRGAFTLHLFTSRVESGPREVVSRVVSMWPFGEGHDNMISLVHKNTVILITSMVYK